MTDRDTINANKYYDETSPLQRSSTRYEVEECLFAGQTDYAFSVVVTNPDYGRMLFLDGELQSSSYDEAIYHETLVHPLMNRHSGVPDKHVLVIGGAEGATVREVLKWSSVKMIDWVDIDLSLIDVCSKFLSYKDTAIPKGNRVTLFSEDIMKFLDFIGEGVYDCIIIDLPDPDPDMPNPLYGADFWAKIKKSLKTGGGIVTHVGPVEPGLGRQRGLDIVREGAGGGCAYHTFIPSFQGEWGFWMNCQPKSGEFPDTCVVMNPEYQMTIFHWDSHWFLNFSQ